jgi:hypothetical protein
VNDEAKEDIAIVRRALRDIVKTSPDDKARVEAARLLLALPGFSPPAAE